MLLSREFCVSLDQNSHHGTSRFDTKRQRRDFKEPQILSLLRSMTSQHRLLQSCRKYQLSDDVVDSLPSSTSLLSAPSVSSSPRRRFVVIFFVTSPILWLCGECSELVWCRVRQGDADGARVYELCRDRTRVALAVCGSVFFLLSSSFSLLAQTAVSCLT